MSITWDTGVTMTVEIAVGSDPYDATPTWTDVSDYLEGITITRGTAPTTIPQAIAGVATVTFNNDDGRFDPYSILSPYYPLAIANPIRVSVEYASTTYRLYYGFVTAWNVTYPDTGLRSLTDAVAADYLQILNQAGIASETYPVQKTSTRITAVLDYLGWPAGMRSLDTGVALVEAFDQDTSVSAFAHLNAAVSSEAGRLFIAGNGDVTFHRRTHHAGGATSKGTFGPSDLPYTDVTVAYDDDFLYNAVEVTVGDGLVKATSASSIGNFGERTLAYTGVGSTANEAHNAAEWQVGQYATQRARITSIELKPQADPSNLWPLVLDVDLRDSILVKTDPPGTGTVLSQQVAVEAITHEITHEEWVTTWECHRLTELETRDSWILGTSVLGTDTILA